MCCNIEVSHIRSLTVNRLLNRSDFFHPRRSFDIVEELDVERQWRTGKSNEEQKRLAYFCFILDTQSVIQLSRNASMSVSRLHLTLPCSPAAWEADSAQMWSKYISQGVTCTTYSSLLQEYRSLSTCLQLPALNALSHILLLYGLIAMSWSLEPTNQSFTGRNAFPRHEDAERQKTASFELWKARFDVYRVQIRAALRNSRSVGDAGLDLRVRSFVSDAIILYHSGNAYVHSGITNLENLDIHPMSHQNNLQHASLAEFWPSDYAVAFAIWHGGHAIREALLEAVTNNHTILFNSAWSVYTSLLVCCKFSLLRQNNEQISPLDEDVGRTNTTADPSCDQLRCHHGLWDLNHQMISAIAALMNRSGDLRIDIITRNQAYALCVGIEGFLQATNAAMLAERVRKFGLCFTDS